MPKMQMENNLASRLIGCLAKDRAATSHLPTLWEYRIHHQPGKSQCVAKIFAKAENRVHKMRNPDIQGLNQALLMIEILRRIPRRRFTTSVQIHQQISALGHEISLRTTQRYLQALANHFPIECDTRGKPYGYRWMEDAEGLNLPYLTSSEALLLQLAYSELKQLFPAKALKSLSPLFNNALRELDNNERNQPARRWLKKVKRLPDNQPLLPPKYNPIVFENISEALYQERKLKLIYQNARSEKKQAIVWPLGLVLHGVRPYLVCRFEGYDNERIIAIPRIAMADILPEKFPWPQDFDLTRYCQSGAFGITEGRQVRLSFTIDKAAGLHLLESPLSIDQQTQDLGDRLRITATVTETRLLHRWLRGWGDQLSDIQMD